MLSVMATSSKNKSCVEALLVACAKTNCLQLKLNLGPTCCTPGFAKMRDALPVPSALIKKACVTVSSPRSPSNATFKLLHEKAGTML